MLQLLQSCPTLCDSMDCSSPRSFAHGILQARILDWFAVPSSRVSPWPGDQTYISCVSCIADGFFILSHVGSLYCYYTKIQLIFYINLAPATLLNSFTSSKRFFFFFLNRFLGIFSVDHLQIGTVFISYFLICMSLISLLLIALAKTSHVEQ